MDAIIIKLKNNEKVFGYVIDNKTIKILEVVFNFELPELPNFLEKDMTVILNYNEDKGLQIKVHDQYFDIKLTLIENYVNNILKRIIVTEVQKHELVENCVYITNGNEKIYQLFLIKEGDEDKESKNIETVMYNDLKHMPTDEILEFLNVNLNDKFTYKVLISIGV